MLIVVLGLLLVAAGSAAAEDVAILHMHGFTEGWPDHVNFKRIVEAHTGLPVYLIDAFNYIKSATPLNVQIPEILVLVKEIAAQYDKVVAVGYSQGGVVWRALIEAWDGHNVDIFISLAAPQHGLYGSPLEVYKDDPAVAQILIPFADWYTTTSIYKLIYSSYGQSLAAFNYYIDPTHYQMYLDYCPFFAHLNNEAGSPEFKARQKANFLGLRRLVLVGGPDDAVVVPWESTQFGYYTVGIVGNVTKMEESKLYKEDLFGLQTLDKRGGVEVCTVEGLDHFGFRNHPKMMDKCVYPNLRDYKWPIEEDN